jgi:hypothetical protein
MTFVTKAGTAISALVVMGLISLGIPEVLPSSYAAPFDSGFSQQAPLVTRLIVFGQSPHGPQLSREQAEAKERERLKQPPKAGDKELIKKANEKIKTREKYEGKRNIKKRENLRRNPPKVSKPRKKR